MGMTKGLVSVMAGEMPGHESSCGSGRVRESVAGQSEQGHGAGWTVQSDMPQPALSTQC